MRVSSGDWKFESCSLHLRVPCEPDFLDQGAENLPTGLQPAGRPDGVARQHPRIEAGEPTCVLDDNVMVDAKLSRLGESSVGHLVHTDGSSAGLVKQAEAAGAKTLMMTRNPDRIIEFDAVRQVCSQPRRRYSRRVGTVRKYCMRWFNAVCLISTSLSPPM
jgi:hypothetical protein